MKKVWLTGLYVLIGAGVVVANQGTTTEQATSGGGVDYLELAIIAGYIVGVLVLLPLVIYSNLKESIFNGDDSELSVRTDLSEFERNAFSTQILEEIEQKLTPFRAEDGTEMITITKGSQAKFVKRGLDYIKKYLAPTDALINERVNEFEGVYSDRAKRVFTGSWWVIISSLAIGVLIFMSTGFTTFIFIHALGILFYVLSSRTTIYGIEKRMKRIGYLPGFIGGAMTGLFLGNGTKYYMKSGSGPWKRDWETEGQMAIIGLFIMFVISLFLGFLASLLGVVNFIFNYSTSFVVPFRSEQRWFEEHIPQSINEMEPA
jgi:hypothetical protein